MLNFFDKRLAVVTVCWLSCVEASTTPAPISAVLDTSFEAQVAKPAFEMTNTTTSLVERSDSPIHDGVLSLQSFEELAHYPKVLEQLFDQAITQGDMALAKNLFPIYKNSPTVDSTLLEYGQALLMRHEGDTRQAIMILERLVANNPQHKPIKFQLAMTQAMDARHKSALVSFADVKMDAELPKGLKRQIEGYEKQLKDKYWQNHLGFRYLDTDNVNNAPKVATYGNWQLPTPKSAHGVGYSIGGSGEYPVFDHVSMNYGLVGFGKYYWDNKDYNDHTTKASLGLGYQKAKHTFEIMPNLSYRRFGGEAYSKSVGLDLRHRTMITPRTQVNHNMHINNVRHDSRTHLDGVDVSMSGTWVHGLSLPYRYVYGGYDVVFDNAKDNSDKSRQAGVRLGVGREWGKVVGDGSLGVHERHYRGADLFQIKREDHLYTANVSFWYKDWQYRGFVPKLVVAYEKTDSNHFMYDNDNHEIYIALQKVAH